MLGISRSVKTKEPVGRNGGFTLIEVITSIAIISIVSVTLLQMFTVSAKSNSIARESDSANALCIEVAEKYKADPYPSGTGYLSLFEYDGTSSYALYFNSVFDRYNTTKTPSADSVYKVVITPTEVNSLTIDEYNYPPPAFDISISSGLNVITLNKSGNSDCTISGNTRLPGPIIFSETTKTAMIPILINCENIATDSTIEVVNNIDKLTDPDSLEEMTAIADFYLYNKADVYTVDIVAMEGVSTSNVISNGEQNMIEYSALVQVIRLSDNKVMAQYNVKKYWVEEVTP